VFTESEPAAAEDVVTDCEFGDGRADCFDLSCELAVQDPLPRPTQADTERLRSVTARPLRRLASRVWQSNRSTVVAWILTRTSSCPGMGRSTCSRLTRGRLLPWVLSRSDRVGLAGRRWWCKSVRRTGNGPLGPPLLALPRDRDGSGDGRGDAVRIATRVMWNGADRPRSMP